jgi:hypothetical protein
MISARKVIVILLCVFAVLLVARAGGLYATYVLGNNHVNGLVPLFDFNQEQSVPTWFSCSLLMMSAALLAVIAAANRYEQLPYRWWTVLSLVFVYLSLDEALSFHERLNRPVRDLLGTGGALYYAWVIPYAMFALGLFVFSVRPLRALPVATRRRLMTAGALFVCGAMGMELVGSQIVTSNRMQVTLLADVTMTIEEILELSGGIVLVYALLKHIASTHPGFGITIAD